MKRRTFIQRIVIGAGAALAVLYSPLPIMWNHVLHPQWRFMRKVVSGYHCSCLYRRNNANEYDIQWWEIKALRNAVDVGNPPGLMLKDDVLDFVTI